MIDDVLDSIGDLCNDPSCWSETLMRIGKAAGDADCALLSYDLASGRSSETAHLELADPALAGAWRKAVATMGRLGEEARTTPPGAILRIDDLAQTSSPADIRPSRDKLSAAGALSLTGGLALVVERSDEVAVILILRPRRPQRTFGVSEETLLEMLHRSLALAVRTTRRLRALQQQIDSFHATVDQVSAGILLLLDGEVIANRQAEAMLEAADGLTLAGGRIKIEGAERQAALMALIDKARAGEPGEMALQRPSGRRPLDLFLRPVEPPIDPNEASADNSLRGVALFIVDPDRQPPQSHGLLREAFGLTRTEAEIARRLASGASIEDIAAATDTSVGTARNHVKRVLAKTRTSRQAELVALIANRPILDLPFR